MENYNTRQVYLNRTPVDMTAGHRFVAYNTEESFKILDYLTLVEFKIFNYLVSLRPHTINGKDAPNASKAPYKVLPAELHQVYPGTSAQSFKRGITGLIEKEILRPTSIPDLYQFDNRPKRFRAEEPATAPTISAQDAYQESESKDSAAHTYTTKDGHLVNIDLIPKNYLPEDETLWPSTVQGWDFSGEDLSPWYVK